MLEPNERTLLRTALEPPGDFTLDFALGTTFSLDLLALLTLPLAFTMFDRDREDASGAEQSVELLASLRRYADRMAIFYQEGRIAFPRARYPQFAWLEQSVVACRKPAGGLFHPKVWVLRYENKAKAIRYRALCLSRNLTLSSAWDTMLAIDGEVGGGGRSTISPEPLADFVGELPALVNGPMSPTIKDRVDQIGAELRTVSFALPQGCTALDFCPMGIPGYASLAFPTHHGRGLVISPFITLPALERVSKGLSDVAVVSSPDALGELPSLPAGYRQFWVLDDDAIAELPATAGQEPSDTGSDDIVELSGLHAKAYVTETNGEAHVWTGSANCTEAGFYQNVEFMVRLAGPTSRFGIDTIMATAKDSLRLGALLKDATSLVAKSPLDEVTKGLKARTEAAREFLVSRGFQGEVISSGKAFDVVVRVTKIDGPALPDGVAISCWPVLAGASLASRVNASSEPVTFKQVSLEGLTSFFAFRIVAQIDGIIRETVTVLNVPLSGVPADRQDRLLRSVIGDRGRLLRFLNLLLAEDGAPPPNLAAIPPGPSPQGDGSADSARSVSLETGLLESLMRALDRAPERLDAIHELWTKTPTDGPGEALFPPQFAAIWTPIWEARQAGVLCATK
jgi:hypothetical protein